MKLEKENKELKDDITLDGFSVIDAPSIDDTTSQKHDGHHDMPESDIAFNDQQYAKYCLECLDDQIKKCEDNIISTNEHHDYKSINASIELKKGFEFKLKRENDKLHVIDEQIKHINKYFSTAPSGNTVLTHPGVNENDYDLLIDKRENVNCNIVNIRVKISGLKEALMKGHNDHHYNDPSLSMSNYNFSIVCNGNGKIEQYEHQIKSLLSEKQHIIQELKSNKLINRITSAVEQIHIENTNKEEEIFRCYAVAQFEPYANGRDYAELSKILKEVFPVSAEHILQYLHFVPKHWFKGEFLARKIFYKDISSMSDYDVYVCLRNRPPGRLFSGYSKPEFDSIFDANGHLSQTQTLEGEYGKLRDAIRVYRNYCDTMSFKYANFISVIDKFDVAESN